MSGPDVPSLLPRPRDDDAEDVAWALSTAEALWKRGERHDAVSWIRKAATAAAEAEADLRVLELAKAAAELSSLLSAGEPTEEILPAAAPAPPTSGPISAEPVPESAIEVELDEAPVAPRRPPPPPHKKVPSKALPTPNPFPSPLRAVALADIGIEAVDVEPVPDDALRPAPLVAPEAEHHESQPRIPTVPPPPPDRAPSQAGMQAVRPASPAQALAPAATPRTPEPRISTIKSNPTPSAPPPPAAPAAPSTPTESAGVSSEVLEAARPRTTRPRPLSMRPAAPPPEPLHLEDLPAPEPPRRPTARPSSSRPAPAIAAGSAPLVPPAPAVPQLDLLTMRGEQVRSEEVEHVEGLDEIPDDARTSLIDAARAVPLAADQAIPAPAAIMVLTGEVEVRSASHAVRIDVIEPGQMRMLAPVAPADSELVVVGGVGGARVLAVNAERVERLRKLAPWVIQELEPASDDVHVVAGALRGKLGVRLDGAVIEEILDRTDVVRLAPSVVVVKKGEPVRALIVVGAGELALRSDDEPEGRVVAGEILFGRELLTQAAAPAQVRAGPAGALLLVATRASTAELLGRAESLVELLREG
jgi:hypothetical protein